MLRSLHCPTDSCRRAAANTRFRSSQFALLLCVTGIATVGAQRVTPEPPWKWEIRAVTGRSTTDDMRDSKGRLTEAGYGDSHYRPAGCLIWCTPARTTPYPQTSSGGITKGLAVTYRVSRRLAIMGQWDGTSLGKTEGFQRTGESIFRVTTGTYATLAAEVASFSLIPMLVLGPNSRIGVGPEVNSVKVRHRDDAGERTENQTRGGLVALATVTTPPWQRMFVAFTLEHHWAGAAVVDPYTVRSSRAGPAAVGRSTIALNRTAGRIGVGIKW